MLSLAVNSLNFPRANRPQCCSPEFQGGYGWGIFNGILGWTNSATYSTVITYNVYWVLIILTLLVMRFHEVKGHWPFLCRKHLAETNVGDNVGSPAATL